MIPLSVNSIPSDSQTIASLVKQQIINSDPTAQVILFGSRTRGDAENESD